MDDFSPKSDDIDAEIDSILGTTSKPKKPVATGKDSVASVLDDEFAKLGYSPTARISILGDVGRENAWNRKTIFGGHSDPKNKAFNRGIISWQGSRRDNLNKHLKKEGVLGRGDDEELRGMARFMDKELQSPEFAKVRHNLLNAKDTYSASEALRRYIKYDPSAPYNSPDKEFRVKNNAIWAKRARQMGLAQDPPVKGGTKPQDVDPITSIDDEIDNLLSGIPQAPEVPDGSVYNKPLDTPDGRPDTGRASNIGFDETGTPNEIFQSRTSNLENPVDVDALQEAMNVASDQSKLADIAQAAKQGINYTKEVEPVVVDENAATQPKGAGQKIASTPVSGSVTTDVDLNDPGVKQALADQAKQLEEYSSEADYEVGNQLRRKAGLSPIDRPREFGKPNENLDGIAVTYQTSPDESEEDAFRSAYIAAGANPSQVEEKIRKLKSLGKPLFSTGYHPGNKIGVSYGDLQDIGVEDVVTDMRMEQAQSRPGLVTPKDIHVGRDFIKDDAEWLNENAGDYVKAINPLLDFLPKGLKDSLGANLASGFLGSGSRMSDAVGGAMRYNPLFDIAKPITGDLPSAMREMAKSGAGLEEKTGDDSFQSQLFKTLGGAPGDLARLYLVTRLPGGIITGMAVDAGLQSAGRGESKSQTATQMAKGAIIGTIFRGAGGLGKFAKSTAGDSKFAQQVFEKGIAGSTILGGTYETEKAFGTPQKKAEHAALINTLFYLTTAGYDMRGKTARVKTADNRTLNGFVDAQGNVRLLKGRIEKPDVEARVDPMAERFNKDQQNRENIAKSQKEGEAKLNNEIYKRQQAEKTETEKLADRGLPEAPPKRVESPTPEAVTKATNHPVAQRVSTILADGKLRTLDDIARESKLKSADKISEAIDTLYEAGQIQINPDGTVQVNGGERPDTSLYDQFDASGRVKPTTVPTTPVAPQVNVQDDDEDLVFTPVSTKKADTKEYPKSDLPALIEADIRRDKFIHPQKNITQLANDTGKTPDEIREILPTLPDYTDAQIAKKYGVPEEQVANLRPLGAIGYDGYTSHRVRATVLDPANEGMFNELSGIFTGGELRFRDADFETKGRMADAVMNKIAESVGKSRASQMTSQDWSKVLGEHADRLDINTVDKIVEVQEEGKDWHKEAEAFRKSPELRKVIDGVLKKYGISTWEDLNDLNRQAYADKHSIDIKETFGRAGVVNHGPAKEIKKAIKDIGKKYAKTLKSDGNRLFTDNAITRAYDRAIYERTNPSPKSGSNTRKVATVSASSGKESPKRGTATASSTQKVAPIKVVKKSEPKSETKPEPKTEPKKAPVVAEKAETREEVAPEPKKASEVKEKPKKPTLEGTKEELKEEKAPIETLHSVPVTAKGQSTADAQVFIEADIDPTVKLTPNKTSSVWRVKSPDGIEVKGATYKEALDIAQRIADGIESGSFFSRPNVSTTAVLSQIKPYTTTVLTKLKQFQGRDVKIQTIRETLKQGGIKAQDKKMIERILSRPEFKDANSIPYDELDKAIRLEVMPLQVIETSTYASYGMQNVGVSGNDDRTYIFNSPISHGEKGHFHGDFGSEHRGWDVGEARDRDTGEVTYMAVPVGQTFQGTTEAEATNFVGHASADKSDVENWIAERGLTLTPTNEGLYGHSRVRRDGKDSYNAEDQSDTYQKQNLERMLIESYLNDYRNNKLKIGDVSPELYTTLRKLSNVTSQRDKLLGTSYRTSLFVARERVDAARQAANRTRQESDVVNRILKSFADEKAPATVISKWKDAVKHPPFIYLSTEEREEWGKTIVAALKGKVPLGRVESILQETASDVRTRAEGYKQSPWEALQSIADKREMFALSAAEEAKNTLEQVRLNVPEYMTYERLVEDEKDLTKDVTKYFTSTDEQFIAHKKNYIARILRETIRIEALADQERFLIPTAMTAARIEGFVAAKRGRGTGVTNNGVYDVISASDEDNLVQGDEIEMGGQRYWVIDATSQNIEVLPDTSVMYYSYSDFASNEYESEYDSMSYEAKRKDGEWMTPTALERFIDGELYLHDISEDDFPEYFGAQYENPDYTEDGDEEEYIILDPGEESPEGAGDPISYLFDWDSRPFQNAIDSELSQRDYDLPEYLSSSGYAYWEGGDGYYYTDESGETFDQPWVIREREEEAARNAEPENEASYQGRTASEIILQHGLGGFTDPVWEARWVVASKLEAGGISAANAILAAESDTKRAHDSERVPNNRTSHLEKVLQELGTLKAEDFTVTPVKAKEIEAVQKLGRSDIEQPVMKGFSDERQTILKKYIELENLFFDERSDVEVVEDKGGNQWLASPLTEADKGDVVVFNKAKSDLEAENIYIEKVLANDYGGWENIGRAAQIEGNGDMAWMNNAARLIISQAIGEYQAWTGVYMTPNATNKLIRALEDFHNIAFANGDTQLAKGIARVTQGVKGGVDRIVGDLVLFTRLPEAPNAERHGVQEEKSHRADLRLQKVADWKLVPRYEHNPAYRQAGRRLDDGPYAGMGSGTIHHEIVGKMFRDDAEIELGLTYNQLQSIRLLHYDQLIASGVTDAQIEKAYNDISKNATAWIAANGRKDAQPNTRRTNATRGSPNAPQFSRVQGSGDGGVQGVDKALAPYPFTRDVAQNVDEKGQRIPQTLFSRPTNIGADAFPDIDGIPESELTMEAHRTRIEKLIADTLPKWLHWVYDGRREVTPAEAIGNTVRAGYLLGASVVLTNVQGNPVNQVVEQGVKVFSGPLDWLNSKINPKSGYERHSPGLSLLDIVEGFFGKKGVLQTAVLSKGKGSIWDVAVKGVGDEEREKFDLLPLVHSRESKKGRWDENVVRNTGIPAWDAAIEASVRISSALDRPFKAFKNASEIRGLARLTATKLRKQGAITNTQYYDFVKQLNKDPNAWMEAVAKRSAQIDTFQNPNAITDEINKIKKKLLTGRFASDVQDVQARQDAAKLVGQLLYLVMTTTAPFLNTPANIGIRALEYTPVGLALGAVRYAKIGKTLERQEWAERMAERRKKEDARIAKERLQENRDIKSILDKYSAQKKAKKAERDQAIADIEASTVMQPEFKKARIKKAKENYKAWEAGWTEAKSKRAQVVDGKLADAGTERAKIDAGIAADRAREDAEANRKFTALENNAFTSGLGRTAFGTTFGSLFFLGVLTGILEAVGYVTYDDDQKEWEKRRDAGIPDASIGAFGYRFPYDNSPLGKALAIGVTAMEQAQRGGSVERRAEGSAKGVFKGLRNLFPYTENRFDSNDEWVTMGKTIKSATPFVNMKILEEAANIIDDKPRTTFKQGITAPFKMTFAREGIPMLGIDPLPVTKHPMGKRQNSMLWRGLQTINPMRSIKQVKEKNWAPSPHKK